MSISSYDRIFKREIVAPCQDLILIYSSMQDVHTFQPLSHHCYQTCSDGCADDCHTRLGSLMRKNLVFYAYSENEIVSSINKGLFDDLEKASVYAYHHRLPKRDPQRDGLPGEVLLDLLVQVLEPDAYKLAVRTIFRQNDGNEIKGYDLTYFTHFAGKTVLWLGQAKLGEKNYCRSGIHDDLTCKFMNVYLSKQLFFLADKQAGITEDAQVITDLINKLNMREIESSDRERAESLISFFRENNISIKIPCLLAYGEGSVYTDMKNVATAIDTEIRAIQDYYRKRTYSFDGFEPEILFLVFPIKDLAKLRGENGFYAGLRRATA